MFAIPWHGRVVVVTTDAPIPDCPLEPTPLAPEIDFLLETASDCLARHHQNLVRQPRLRRRCFLPRNQEPRDGR